MATYILRAERIHAKSFWEYGQMNNGYYRFGYSHYQLKILLIVLATVTAFLIFVGKANASALTKIHDTKITSVKASDNSDWVIKGTTKAPSGTKIYAITAKKHGLDHGINAASDEDEIKWARVKHGKFTAYVEPLSLDGSSSFKVDEKYKIYVFAAKGGIKSYIKSNTTKPLSKKSVNKVAKKATKKTLTLTASQAKYIESLDSDDGEEDNSSSSTENSDTQGATKNQLDALEQAKSYSSTMFMSKQGIYKQLTSSYGEDMSDTDAQYAVDHLKVDYNENALKTAENYNTDEDMSKEGIRKQLMSIYGDSFTEQEAQYAIDNLTADYNKNALNAAREYKNQQEMAPDEIREQLTSAYGEQFTPEEADYAIQHLGN